MEMTSQKTLLAKLLATENITVQYAQSAKTAMFDLKQRLLILPIWQNVSNDLHDMLIVHEVGHALDTPTNEYKNAIETIARNVFGSDVTRTLEKTVGGFLNVIEDARIDKRQKRRYPGSRKNYLAGYKELIERDFFGTSRRDINSMNFIDRLNMYFKGGSDHVMIKFTPEERSFLKRVENLETFEETVALTEEIYRFCKSEIETSENDLINTDYIEIEGEETDEEGTAIDYDGDDWDEGDGAGDEDDSEDGDGGDKSDNDGYSNTAGDGAGADDDITNAPRSLTDEAWQDKSQSLVKDENTEYVYVNLPDVDWGKAINDYKVVLADMNKSAAPYLEYVAEQRQSMIRWRAKEKETISFMVKEFEQRKAAELYARQNIAKTGVIDTNKLHSYKFNDDIFRRLTTIPQGKNHGFVMFVDWSGSMIPNLRDTIKQLLSLAMFCKQIQVPFEVYTFKDSVATNPFIHNKDNTLKLGNVVLRNVLSSRMNNADLMDAFTYLWAIAHGVHIYSECLSGTPLNEAIILAPKVVNDFRTRNKLEIVNTIFLTDGDSNPLVGLANKVQENSSVFKRRRHFLTSNGKTHEIRFGWGNGGDTSTLLRILKDKCECNLIGFFLFERNFQFLANRFNLTGNGEFLNGAKKFWTDNKFYPVKSEGYDEYYIINTHALKDVQASFDISKAKTTRGMAKEFSKFSQKKLVNRVLLRSFVEKIASAKKTAT